MADVTTERLGTQELWEQFSGNPLAFHRQVADQMNARGIEDTPTLSRAFEYASPSEKGDSLDAFGRLMQQAGIRAKSDPAAGYWASPASAFLKNRGTRALLQEFFARQWRKVAFAGPAERAVLIAGDATPGGWERPYADAMLGRWDQRIEPAIPLSELVAMTTPISGADYRATFLVYDAEELRKFRVGETANIPLATITTSENVIPLHKYGRGIRASYELLRRMRVDKLARMIQMMAVQSEVDKVAAALDVLINGDGNNNAATVYDINGDFGETAGSLTLGGWLQFRMAFEQPYILTTALMPKDEAIDLAMLDVGATNSATLVYQFGGLAGGISPINRTADNVRYGWTDEAPTDKIVGFDRRFALEHVVEIGSDITESERFIQNQTEEMYMSEVSGFAILESAAIKVLDVST